MNLLSGRRARSAPRAALSIYDCARSTLRPLESHRQVAQRTPLLVGGLGYIRRVVRVGLTRWNDTHPGFGRRNRPRPPAAGRFEADLGTARGRSYRVCGCARVSTARCTPPMGFLDVSINDTPAMDREKAPGLVP